MIYDDFQKKAIAHIDQGHSVIVSAPTGAGKTVIAEYVITDCLAKGLGCVYTAPIKALSNQKFRDFQAKFPDKIGLLTGDVTINPMAPILIMTTEIFRNKVLDNPFDMSKHSWIIFDEIHYLDDYERGTVWEESLIFLPRHMKLLALSATIPNMKELAEWLKFIHERPFHVIEETKRPVPLHMFFQAQGRVVDEINKLRGLAFNKSMFHYVKGKRYMRPNCVKANKVVPLINELNRGHRLPCIYFVFSRKRAEYLADEISGINFLNNDERTELIALYRDLCVKFGLQHDKSAIRLEFLIERGVAYHHAGMLPTLKEVIERLFTSRLLKVIFTTETFSLGINMPARTVVFDELRKFYGKSHRPMRTRDFFQMAGRAGRRGIDTEGFVYLRINPTFTSFDDIKRTVQGDFEKVYSRFNASYATILNLYAKYKDELYKIYPMSFHYFQESKRSKRRAQEIMMTRVRILKDLEHISEGKLTPKGYFASKVYGYELPLGELYESSVLQSLDETELGVLSLALVYEPRKGTFRPLLDRSSKKLLRLIEPHIKRIHSVERNAGIIDLSKEPQFHLAAALEAWMANEPFESILKLTDADEGEIIRYFRMSVQILREMMDTDTDPHFKDKVRKTISLINRDIVDAEKQLRI